MGVKAMPIKTGIIKELTQALMTIVKENKNGVLLCKSKEIVGEIHFFSGKLIYIVLKKHRVRRWKRGLLKLKIEKELETISFSNEQPWEYEFLHHELSKKSIGMTQIKEIIRAIAEEAFFELLGYADLEFQWQDKVKTQSGLVLVLALSGQEIELMLDKVNRIRQEWDSQGLKTISPSLAPLLKNHIEEGSISFINSASGKLTLWDLALQQHKSITELSRLLIPYIRKGIIRFKEIPDLSLSPASASSVTATSPSASVSPSSPPAKKETVKRKSVLIACIDDSPVVAHNIKKILTPIGYDILAIPEPMHGFSQLIEHQPQLILLDINMPNANGYSVCQFLRNSPVFEKTPIIILTGQDTNIDRARAKLVGATDFLAKPPQPDILISLINKYLSSK